MSLICKGYEAWQSASRQAKVGWKLKANTAGGDRKTFRNHPVAVLKPESLFTAGFQTASFRAGQRQAGLKPEINRTATAADSLM